MYFLKSYYWIKEAFHSRWRLTVEGLIYFMEFFQLPVLCKAEREDDSQWGKVTKILGDLWPPAEAEPETGSFSCSGRSVTDRPAADRALLWSGGARLLGYCDCGLLCGTDKVRSGNHIYALPLLLLSLFWMTVNDTLWEWAEISAL
jgi:hypothetical protein